MELILVLGILIFSAILHEVAHGYVADRFGDPTARLAGRLTLNPKSHIDPLMSILLPLMLLISGSPILFGGAKPVPVDPFNLKEGRKDVALVALAGPLTNVLLAVGAGIIYRVFFASTLGIGDTNMGSALFEFILLRIIDINLLLAIFNLLPLPPLDGSKIFSLLLPEKEAHIYQSQINLGFLILFILLLMPIGSFSLGNFINQLLVTARGIILP